MRLNVSVDSRFFLSLNGMKSKQKKHRNVYKVRAHQTNTYIGCPCHGLKLEVVECHCIYRGSAKGDFTFNFVSYLNSAVNDWPVL